MYRNPGPFPHFRVRGLLCYAHHMATRVHHLDADFPEHVERTPQGGAVIPAKLTTSGVVRYIQPDGSVVREYRSPAEVNNPESLATLEHIPVTLEHPGLVTRGNFREHTRGHVVAGSIQPQPDGVNGKVVVQDSELLDDIATKRRTQLSPGYNATIDPTPGVVPDGEPDAGQPFDKQQRNIRYNHIAVTVKGRQGDDVALRLDSNGDFAGSFPRGVQPQCNEGKTTMRKVTINGVQYIIGGTDADNEALERAIQRETARFDSEAGTRDGEATKLRAELLAAVARAETAEKRAADAVRYDSTDMEVLMVAAKVLGPEYDPNGKTPADIMRDVVTKAAPGVDLSGKSDDYIAGLFDGIAAGEPDGDEPTNADAPTTDEPAAPADANQPADAGERHDSANAHPSLQRANLAATPLGTSPGTRALPLSEQLRAETIARGRAPLKTAG